MAANRAIAQPERRISMARLRHFAVCVNDLDKAAKFYETVFELKRIAREDLEIGSAIYMSDGVINLALLNFTGSAGSAASDLKKPEGLRRRAPFRLPGRRSRRDAEAHRGGRRQVLLRSRRRASRQLRAQVQGPRRRHLRHFQERLAGHRQLREEIAVMSATGGRVRPSRLRSDSADVGIAPCHYGRTAIRAG